MWSAFALIGMAVIAGPVLAAGPDCAASLLPPPTHAAGARKIESRDLVGLRDTGPSGDYFFGRTPLSMSPDGKHLAFELHRGDLASNGYCMGLVVVDLVRSDTPRLVDVGGEFVPWSHTFRGIVGRPIGAAALLQPKWSPDGRWIAFLRRDHGVTQVWRVRSNGADGAPLTHEAEDVLGFAWTANGSQLLYSNQPGIIAAQAVLDRQARTGYPFGAGFEPMVSNRPFVTGSIDVVLHSVDVTTGAVKLVTASDRSAAAAMALPEEISAQTEALAPDRRRAWTTPANPDQPFGAKRLQVQFRGTHAVRCDTPQCDNIVELVWSNDGRRLFYLRREGWGQSRYGLYRWAAGQRQPGRVAVMAGWIDGCVAGSDRLLCLTERSTEPRRIVSVNPANGHMETLFDPNPEFRSLILGSVKRLFWKTALGSEGFGDLVLPSDYHKGEPLPLIVVQYESRGFLRGGTGDEYPIQPLAERGYAVLSVNRPELSGLRAARTDEQMGREALRNWTERRNVVSSIMAGVDAAERLGIVDPRKVGITGLSDGSTALEFALINSRRFAVAETSSCCMAGSSFLAYLNAQAAAHFRMEGYPGVADDGRAFWKPMSLLQNADRIDAPILMQLSDEEYLGAVQVYAALRERQKPVDMIIYPDEHHFKWQPSHRDAIYRRSIAWFDFWLKGEEDADLVDAADLDRWRSLRGRRVSGGAAHSPQSQD